MTGVVPECLEVREVEEGSVARPIFQRRFRSDPPEEPCHVVAFHREAGIERPLCYVHFTPMPDYMLGGGACVDDRVIRAMPRSDREAVAHAGGPYHLTLAWAVRHFAPRTPAIFGYCGDVRAERVDLAVGFEKTPYRHLLVYWTRDLDDAERRRLVELAHAHGPF